MLQMSQEELAYSIFHRMGIEKGEDYFESQARTLTDETEILYWKEAHMAFHRLVTTAAVSENP